MGQIKKKKSKGYRIAGPIQCGTIYFSLFTNKILTRKHMRLKEKGKGKNKNKNKGLNCCLGMQWKGKTFTPFTVQIFNCLACGRHITIHFSFEDFASCFADEEVLPLVLGA